MNGGCYFLGGSGFAASDDGVDGGCEVGVFVVAAVALSDCCFKSNAGVVLAAVWPDWLGVVVDALEASEVEIHSGLLRDLAGK